MQAIIIAGGRGKRLGNITKKIPKPLVKIGGKPVLAHQIELLRKSGIKEVWLLLGYKGEMIREYFGDGKRFNLKIYYAHEQRPLGTAGAVKNIAKKIRGDFLVLYGDVMVNFDLQRFIRFHHRRGKGGLATIVVHPNNHPRESDLVEVKNHQVINIYPKPQPVGAWRHNLVSAGVYILSPKIFSNIPANKESDFGKHVFPQLLKRHQKIIAYRTWEYFRDMGSPKDLKLVRQDFAAGILQKLNFQNKQKAIFLDRDGVINKEDHGLTKIEDLVIYPFSFDAIKKINASGFHAIVLTNQAQIAKGKLTESELDQIHCKLETLLGERGAKLDAIYYCPHHPQRGWPGEIKALKIKCNCRKPKIGMIEKAARDFNLDLKQCYFIGDSLRFDYLAARNAKVKFVGVKTGHGLEDFPRYGKMKVGKFPLKKNLAEVVNYIIKITNLL